MTAEQVLGIATVASDMLQNTERPPTAPLAPAAPEFADDEYLTGAQFRRALEAARATPDTTAITLAADANLAHVRSQNAADFTKYGTEINALIARIPANLRTIDNLSQAVRMVRSDHVDEIAAERAQQLASTMTSTLRPTGGGAPLAPVSPEHSLESEKIPAEWKTRARAANITEETVREFCQANGITPIDFYKQFDTPRNAIVGEVSQKRTG